MSIPAPDFRVERQPDDLTCGPTCLHAVYAHFGDEVPLHVVTAEVPELEHGGTYAPLLGQHALRRGYSATVHSCDLELFDPTWPDEGDALVDLLRRQARRKSRKALRAATAAYIGFLELGGRVEVGPMNGELLRGYLRRGIPVLTGLSATFLYWSERERMSGPREVTYDAVGGFPVGHFVVVHGYDADHRRMWLADPLHDNPLAGTSAYSVETNRLISAILLGASTFDASILVLEPGAGRGR